MIDRKLKRRTVQGHLRCAVVSAMMMLSWTQPLVSQNSSEIRFDNRQPHSGVDFVLNNGTTSDKPIIDSILGGVALLDYDNDGYLDIFFSNGAQIPSLSKDAPRFYNRLYHNNHDGTFTDVTDRAGLRGTGYSIGAAAADFDNDGWTDLYVSGINRNILYRNNRDGTFTDVTDHAGVSGVTPEGKKLLSLWPPALAGLLLARTKQSPQIPFAVSVTARFCFFLQKKVRAIGSAIWWSVCRGNKWSPPSASVEAAPAGSTRSVTS